MAEAVRVSVTVNGQTQTAEVEPRLLLVHFLRDTLGPDRHARRLRHVELRRMHRPSRRRLGQELHDPRGAGRRVERPHDRGHGRRRRPAPAAGGVLGRARPAVRLLHAGHDHGRRRPAGAQPRPLRARDPRGARRATCAAARATTTSSRRSSTPRELQRAATAPEPEPRAARRRPRRRCRHERGERRHVHVGRADAAQGGPAADRGQGQLRRRHHAAGHALGGVRALARGARHDRLDRHVGRARARRRRGRLHRRRPRPRGAAPAGLGPARRRRRPRRRTGRSPRAPSSTSATRSRSSSAPTATRSSTRPRTSSSTTTRCRSSSIPRRRSRAAMLVHADLGTNKVHEWSLGGDVEARWSARRS